MNKKKITLISIISAIVVIISISLIVILTKQPNINCKREDEHIHNYESVEVAPTCILEGYTKHICKCGDEYIDSYKEKVEHQVTYETIKESTCSEEGIREGKCIICNKVYREYLPLLPHKTGKIQYSTELCNGLNVGYIHCLDCNELITTVGHKYEIEYIPSTCKETGKQISTCIYCGDTFELEIPQIDHEKGEEIVTLSTCEEPGKIETYCKHCNTLLYSTPLKLNNHEYSSIINENLIEYTCIDCNHSYTEEIETEYYKVSFVTNNQEVIEDVYVKEGQNIKPKEISKEGYEFVGWYLDEGYEIPYTEDPIWEDTILYALFGLSYLETEYEENIVESNVDSNFTFNVESNIKLTNNNINQYITVKSSQNEQVKINVSEINGLYCISSQEYQSGEIYNVEVKDGITLCGSKNNQLTFMVKPLNETSVIFKDNVKVLNTLQVNCIVNEEEKDIVILKEEMLNTNDIFVVVDNNDFPQGMYQVESYIYDGVNYIYTCTVPKSEEVFEEFEISASGNAQIEQVTLDEEYLVSMVESYKRSKLSKIMDQTISEFSNTPRMKGYTFDDIEFELISDGISKERVQLGLKIIATWKGTNGAYKKIVVKFVDTIMLDLSYNIKLTDYRINIDLHNTFNFGLSLVVGNKYDSVQSTDDISLLEFRKIYNNLNKGQYDELISDNKALDERKQLATIMLNVYGIPVEVKAFSGMEWDMYGQIGFEGTMTYTQSTIIWGNLFDINSRTSKSSTSYLMLNVAGKIYFNPYLEVEIIIGVDNIFSAHLSGQVGLYEEIGGMASVIFGLNQKPVFNSGIYFEYGINVELNLVLEVLGLRYNLELINEDIELYSIGTKEVPLYFENTNTNKNITISYDETINLNEKINNIVFINDFDNMSNKTEDVDCEYSIYEIDYGTIKYITLNDNNITIKPNENTELTIKFKIVYKNLIDYQTITFKVNHTHKYNEVERKDSGCESQGYIKYGCNCGYQYLELLDPIGHEFIDDVCISCGYEQMVYSKGLQFNKVEGGYEVIGYTGEDEIIKIPEIYEGEYVIGIKEGANIGNNKTKKFSIPSTIKYVGGSGLHLHDSIEYNIYENIKYLGNRSNPYLVLIDVVTETLSNYNIHLDTKIIYDWAFGSCKNVKYLEIPNGVTVIGDFAFAWCNNLKYIEIPNSVKRIGGNAFYYSNNLQGTEYDNGIYLGNEENPYLVFLKVANKEIESCTIHDNTICINTDAFDSCQKIKKIKIPDSVVDIGESAFFGCISLESIELPDGITSIASNTFQNCDSLKNIKIPEGVTSIGFWAFAWCDNLTNVEIPNSVTSINSSFYECRKLLHNGYENGAYLGNPDNPYLVLAGVLNINITSFKIHENTKIIGSYAFNACKALINVRIPEGVISISSRAFSGCTSLKEIDLPNNLTIIGENAFEACSSLTSITIPGGVTTIEDYTFSWCSSLCTINLPNSLINIGSSAFSHCSKLTSITIPEGVTSIGVSTFLDCSSLTKINFSKYITSIGSYAFSGCSRLSKIEIPSCVTKIGEDTFKNCKNLTIYCEAKSKPSGWDTNWNSSNRPVVWGYTE